MVTLYFTDRLPSIVRRVAGVSRGRRALIPSIPIFKGGLFSGSFVARGGRRVRDACDLLTSSLSGGICRGVLGFCCANEVSLLPPIAASGRTTFNGVLGLNRGRDCISLNTCGNSAVSRFLRCAGNGCGHVVTFRPGTGGFRGLGLRYGNVTGISL